jgi:hypothetical protein
MMVSTYPWPWSGCAEVESEVGVASKFKVRQAELAFHRSFRVSLDLFG